MACGGVTVTVEVATTLVVVVGTTVVVAVRVVVKVSVVLASTGTLVLVTVDEIVVVVETGLGGWPVAVDVVDAVMTEVIVWKTSTSSPQTTLVG